MTETVHYDGHIIRVITKPVPGIPAFEVVEHPGAVAVLAHDKEFLYLVEQDRPAIGRHILELPAGTVEGFDSDPVATADRELQEEIGKRAKSYMIIGRFLSSPGWTNEKVILVEAWDLEDSSLTPDATEDISIVKWELDKLSELLAVAEDAKLMMGVLILQNMRLYQ